MVIAGCKVTIPVLANRKNEDIVGRITNVIKIKSSTLVSSVLCARRMIMINTAYAYNAMFDTW